MMFTPRLHSVVSEASCIGIAKVLGYKLYFHKRGHNDPSGKCNIVPVKDSNSEVYGVVYEIPTQNRCLLESAEGLGYGSQEITLKVFGENNELAVSSPLNDTDLFAVTYVADKDNIFEDLVPFSWYKEIVLSGAREHNLPLHYIHQLEQYASTPDPNVQRAIKQRRYLESILF